MSEVGPSPEIETEKEATGISLAKEIADLRDGAETDEDFQVILEKTQQLKELFGIGRVETKLSGEISEQIEKAKEILGSDVFGPEAIIEAFGESVELGEIPPIPFSSEELEKAKELGQMLILRAGKLTDGRNLGMKEIGEILEDKVKDDGKVFYDSSWYNEEKFFIEDPIENGWALVSKDVIPDSTSKDYWQQSRELAIYIKDQVFSGTPNEEYQEAITEFEKYTSDNFAGKSDDEINNLLKETGWEKYAGGLSNLKLNQLCRQSPAETLYDLIVHFQNTGERLLPDKYTWTKRRYSGGGLVSVGCVRVRWCQCLRGRAWLSRWGSRRCFLPQSLIL